MNLLLEAIRWAKNQPFLTTLLEAVSKQSHKNSQSFLLFCFSQLKYLHLALPDRYSKGRFVRDTHWEVKTIFVEKKVIRSSVNSINAASTF